MKNYVLNCNIFGGGNIVSNLYDSFTKETPGININHILMGIEYLIGKEPDLVFYYLIEYNMLFKLAQMMEQS